ncbi:CD5 antigen-like [Ptychodera flava]|uniref:CD5 antigen-like n=1 Tax=Ptychodera flava TaxID=63121 RepID=UPI003969EDE3
MITILVSGVSVVFCAFVLFGLTVADTGGSERVRLVNGRNRYEGRVEVTLQSTSWTPVCQSRWDLHDANILCKELGRPGAMMSGRDDNALENDERERIVRVDCDEDSESITQCDYEYNRWCRNAATAKCNYDGYLGCYSDDDEFPALPGGATTIDQMTIQSCLDHCRSRGMYYAGLGPPNYCYCGREGTDYGQHGYASDSCLERCEGDEGIEVYTSKNSEKLNVCMKEIREFLFQANKSTIAEYS